MIDLYLNPALNIGPWKFRFGTAVEMAGGSHSEEANLKGISKYFNSVTLRGRANVAMATYAGVALLGLYLYLKPKKATTDKK
ncbi:hypothetical protein CHUAL_009212 [Chamberlinius hualienensis]